MTSVKRATTTIDASPSVTIAELVPEEWRAFMRSGKYMRTSAFIHADGAQARVDLAAFPMPAYELAKIDRYFMGTIQFSSGCPYQCEFCDIPGLYGRVARLKTLSS